MPITLEDKVLIIKLSDKVERLIDFVPDEEAGNAMSIVVFTSDGETDDWESIHAGNVAAIAYNLMKTTINLLSDCGMDELAIVESFRIVAMGEG